MSSNKRAVLGGERDQGVTFKPCEHRGLNNTCCLKCTYIIPTISFSVRDLLFLLVMSAAGTGGTGSAGFEAGGTGTAGAVTVGTGGGGAAGAAVGVAWGTVYQ